MTMGFMRVLILAHVCTGMSVSSSDIMMLDSSSPASVLSLWGSWFNVLRGDVLGERPVAHETVEEKQREIVQTEEDSEKALRTWASLPDSDRMTACVLAGTGQGRCERHLHSIEQPQSEEERFRWAHEMVTERVCQALAKHVKGSEPSGACSELTASLTYDAVQRVCLSARERAAKETGGMAAIPGIVAGECLDAAEDRVAETPEEMSKLCWRLDAAVREVPHGQLQTSTLCNEFHLPARSSSVAVPAPQETSVVAPVEKTSQQKDVTELKALTTQQAEPLTQEKTAPTETTEMAKPRTVEAVRVAPPPVEAVTEVPHAVVTAKVETPVAEVTPVKQVISEPPTPTKSTPPTPSGAVAVTTAAAAPSAAETVKPAESTAKEENKASSLTTDNVEPQVAVPVAHPGPGAQLFDLLGRHGVLSNACVTLTVPHTMRTLNLDTIAASVLKPHAVRQAATECTTHLEHKSVEALQHASPAVLEFALSNQWASESCDDMINALSDGDPTDLHSFCAMYEHHAFLPATPALLTSSTNVHAGSLRGARSTLLGAMLWSR